MDNDNEDKLLDAPIEYVSEIILDLSHLFKNYKKNENDDTKNH